jgi:4-hydroxythreonine-4-phosphate dehydrogenase
VIGITLGDPAGIGPEVTLKALARLKHAPVMLIGSWMMVMQTAERLGIRPPKRVLFENDGTRFGFEFGKVQKGCGAAALRALDVGVALVRDGTIQGLVTAPVSKEALRLAGFEFPGQTEFLAARLGAKRHAMLAYAPEHKGAHALRIVFVTIHRPLADVPAGITRALVAEKIRLLHDFLRGPERIARPKIAVFALNPHGYEFTLGEEARIARGMGSARVAGVEGPFPADTIGQLLPRFDGFVAMYHDQAMIPAKLLAQGRGVNLTLGLPAVRTSPLHGTAFDIAGKGVASADSMVAAIETAMRLAARAVSSEW